MRVHLCASMAARQTAGERVRAHTLCVGEGVAGWPGVCAGVGVEGWSDLDTCVQQPAPSFVSTHTVTVACCHLVPAMIGLGVFSSQTSK